MIGEGIENLLELVITKHIRFYHEIRNDLEQIARCDVSVLEYKANKVDHIRKIIAGWEAGDKLDPVMTSRGALLAIDKVLKERQL
jgi:hypothetical protein